MATEAWPFVIGLGVVGLVLAMLAGPWGAAPPLFLALFVLYFFRDPERTIPSDEGIIVAPADGRVTAVTGGPDGARISIFLSLFDCHVNRAPVSGTVRARRYTPGRYRAAWDPRAGDENERNHLEIEGPDGRYGLTQIAGLVARRIVCRKDEGDTVRRGERIGLIRFGSRTDLRLAPGLEPAVRVGDRVRGGVSVMARAAAGAAAATNAAARR